jgi:hypothetical protein
VAVRTPRVGEIAAELAARMAADVGSVGVIVPDASREPVERSVGAETEEALSSGVNVLALGAIKGLEFDAAIVIEPGQILAERPDGGRGGLYTALTRSTRALAIVHHDALPPELAAATDIRTIQDAAAAAEAWAVHRRG